MISFYTVNKHWRKKLMKSYKYANIKFLLLFFLFVCNILILERVQVQAEDENKYQLSFSSEKVVFEDFSNNFTCETYTYKGKEFLFLPSYVDSEDIFVDENFINMDGDTHIIPSKEYEIVGKNNKLIVYFSKNIATISLTTEDDLEWIHESKENKTHGQATIIENDGKVAYSGELTEFKGRGNTTWTQKKKPYQIKIKKTNLLGMGKAKTWLLLANAYDDSLIKNKLVYDCANEIGLPYSPDCQFADLYINRQYLGNYLLSEKVQIGENRIEISDLEKQNEISNPDYDLSSLTRWNEDNEKLNLKGVELPNDINPRGGYLLECDQLYSYNQEPSGFRTSEGIPVVIKSPEYASRNEVNFIAEKVQEFETAIVDGGGG